MKNSSCVGWYTEVLVTMHQMVDDTNVSGNTLSTGKTVEDCTNVGTK